MMAMKMKEAEDEADKRKGIEAKREKGRKGG